MTYPLHVLHTRSCAPGAVLEGGGRPVTINVPSRYIPVLGVVLASVTIFGSVGLNLYHGHDIGGIPWPYISDTVRHSLPLPPSPFLSLSLSLSPLSLARSLAHARTHTHRFSKVLSIVPVYWRCTRPLRFESLTLATH